MTDLEDNSWICIARGPRESLAEASLVLTAMSIEHRVEAEERVWGLLVPLPLAMNATTQLQKYRQENRYLPPPAKTVFDIDSGWYGVLGYVVIIWMLPWLEANWAYDWREAGNMHAALVRDGEWWRCITALTLHADIGHIVANSFFGAAFGLFVGRRRRPR